MNFKKLEVSGFKSFADKLAVSFSQGITAIVGPNGCGKSNVADSIRWVLGEQSSKLLRGANMQDVIFGGTEKRKSLSYAEVSLFFDNKDKVIPLDYNEVVISRKLYRSGESEYFVNKQLCRLKDVIALLRDSGIGREGYSIIGQGRIDTLLSAKPEDRRAIFEEAAGISKYKAQKRETELKLERTQGNIVRLVDIKEEKAKLLAPISVQAEIARQYIGYRERLKDIEINIYLYQQTSVDKAKVAITARLEKACNELDKTNDEYNQASQEWNNLIVEITELDNKLQGYNQQLLKLTVENEQQAGDVKLVKHQMQALTEQNTDLQQRLDKLRVDKENIESLKLDNQSHQSKLGLEIHDYISKIEQGTIKFVATSKQLVDDESEYNKEQQSLLKMYDKLGNIAEDSSQLLAKKTALQTIEDGLKTQIATIKKQVETQKTTITTGNATIAINEEKKDELLQATINIEALIKECLADLSKITNATTLKQAEFFNVSAKLKLSLDMRETMEGFGYTVKRLVADSKSSDRLKSLIGGIVGKIIKVDKKYEIAIETALGAAIQNIIVTDENAAKELIEYLRFKKYGRATFLPLSSIKPKSIDARYLDIINNIKACGVASDLVSCDESFKKAIKGLLGATVIVDNLEAGINLAKKTNYAFKIVSLVGDLLGVSGAITGGEKSGDSVRVFGYEREINEYEAGYDKLKLDIENLDSEKKILTDKHSELVKNLNINTKSIALIDVELAKLHQNKNIFESDILNCDTKINNFNTELMNTQTQLIELEQKINVVKKMHSDTQGKTITNNDIVKNQAKFAQLRTQRDELNHELTNLRLELVKLESEHTNCIKQEKQLHSDFLTVEKSISDCLFNINHNNNKIVTHKSQLELSNDFVKAESDIQRITSTIQEVVSNKANLQDRQSFLDKVRMDSLDNIRKFTDAKTKEELQLIKVDSDIELLKQRIFDEYGLLPEECVKFKRDIAITQSTQEQSKLKKAINALGTVNLAAIEQSQELYSSYNTLCEQLDDLEKAKFDLISIINSLNKEMNGRFMVEFEKIRHNFIGIFKELFNGGFADLQLLITPDMTDAELLNAGIEIVAQPPEKKLQSISLLSGGEKALTAIAILFAILRLKPMPFCVLDEIEAALDDANAHRFAEYLRRFSQDTQFIVITHRKPTMELADSLYGVTMEEKGVSKIVSVKLSEAIKVAETTK